MKLQHAAVPETRRRPEAGRCLRAVAAVLVTVLGTLLGALLTGTPARAAGSEVVNVRFGQSADRVNVIIDLKAASPYRAETAANGRVLIVGLPFVRWQAPAKQTLAKLPPLQAYRFVPGGRPTDNRVEFTADRPIKVVGTQTFLPDREHSTHRVMVTIAPAQEAAKPAALPAKPPQAKPSQTPAPAPALVHAAAPAPVPVPTHVGAPVAAAAAAIAVASASAAPAPAPAPARSPTQPIQLPKPLPPPPTAPQLPPAIVSSTALSDQALDQGSRLITEQKDYPDYAAAIRWFRKSAALGNPRAAFNLAELYRTGKGVPQNLSDAAAWYDMASQAGLAPAQFLFGVLLYNGTGVIQDRPRAIELFKRSAAQNFAQAQQALREIEPPGNKGAR